MTELVLPALASACLSFMHVDHFVSCLGLPLQWQRWPPVAPSLYHDPSFLCPTRKSQGRILIGPARQMTITQTNHCGCGDGVP